VPEILDAADSRLRDYRDMSDAALLEQRGLFMAEGRLVVRRLLAGRRFGARSVLVTATARQALDDVLEGRPDVPVYVVSQALMNGITGFNIHRGCLAAGVRRADDDWRVLVSSARRLVLLERVANADNVGGIFRNAAALGADAVLLDGATTDPLYRKAIRTSMGAALSVPFARAEPWLETLARLRGSGVVLIGLTPDREALPLDAFAQAVAGQRAAILLGHEGDGLSDVALASCDHRARIPIASGVDSLNVASAAAIALYELRS
jgi:tRNA G18 (ribose-2'-O)-methylase SpoU